MDWRLKDRLINGFVTWLMKEEPPQGLPLSDYERMANAILPGDVLLVEGRSRIGQIIKVITQSSWSHSALYIGTLKEIQEPWLRKKIIDRYHFADEERLIVEAILGQGVIVSPLSVYRREHIRICRPKGILEQDVRWVIGHAINRLGDGYDNFRPLRAVAKLLLPYSLMPRRWRSAVFERQSGQDIKTVCSCMLAEAFMSVRFPIIPVVQRDNKGELVMYPRNSHLLMPRDFDHSPYFEIVKYPLVSFDDLSNYNKLPWNAEGMVCNDVKRCHATLAGSPNPVVVNVGNQAGEALRI